MNKLKFISGTTIKKWLFTIFISVNIFFLRAEDVNILDLGAKPDGKTLVTDIIGKAIDRCVASGGGRVVFPAGKYLTGTIVLKSNVGIHLEKGAVILGSTDTAHYQSMKTKYAALRTRWGTKQLIYAEGQENISITGFGTVDGQGGSFKPDLSDNFGVSDVGITRPHLIMFITCRDVRVEDVTLTNSAAWMQHYLACDRVRIRGIRVHNFSNHNNDGVDIDGCYDVTISDCIFSSADDGITFKATGPRSCENVVVNNCVVHSFSNAIKMGTETTGGFRNISISNIAVSPPEDTDFEYNEADGVSAIALMIADGGVMENINISNVTVSRVVCPIFIHLSNRARKHSPDAPEPPVGKVRNIRISNLTAISSHRISSHITGIPGHPVENVVFQNITLINRSQGSPADSEQLVPPVKAGYPHPRMYGRILPASAFYVRDAQGIRFNNIEIIVEGKDYRNAFVFEDVSDISIVNPVITPGSSLPGLLRENNCHDIQVIK